MTETTGLLRAFENTERGTRAAYQQSHPYEHLYTAQALKEDELTLNNNYMKIIFGGDVHPNDFQQRAYNFAMKQVAETPMLASSGSAQPDYGAVLRSQSDRAVTKDSLIDAFRTSRHLFKGRVDTESEQAIKSRASADLTLYTFHGKRQMRTHPVGGQAVHLEVKPSECTPQSLLSSRTYATQDDGTAAPLYTRLYDEDPRAVSLSSEPRTIPDARPGDVGPYQGMQRDIVLAQNLETRAQPLADYFATVLRRP